VGSIPELFPEVRINILVVGRSSGLPNFLKPSRSFINRTVARVFQKVFKRLTAAGTAPEFIMPY